ncbi:MAG: hypothetical protein JNK64_37085 [Myxococcales bacterium]|nr:hypothetical protein [Myxococcales bacterium]
MADPTDTDTLDMIKDAVDPERLTFAESVKSASAWGRAVASAIPESSRPLGAAPRELRIDPPSPDVTLSGQTRAARPPTRDCTCADEDCLPVPFVGGEASWTLASTPPKPFAGATSFGWHDFRTITTPTDPNHGSYSLRISWQIPTPHAGAFIVRAPGGVPFFAHATGFIAKNPHLIWEAARVRVVHYLWLLRPTPLGLTIGTLLSHRVLLDVTSAWFEGNKSLAIAPNQIISGVPAGVVVATSAGAPVTVRSELEVQWAADGGARVKFSLDEYTIRTEKLAAQFALCD